MVVVVVGTIDSLLLCVVVTRSCTHNINRQRSCAAHLGLLRHSRRTSRSPRVVLAASWFRAVRAGAASSCVVNLGLRLSVSSWADWWWLTARVHASNTSRATQLRLLATSFFFPSMLHATCNFISDIS
jgi:hypothetical protein